MLAREVLFSSLTSLQFFAGFSIFATMKKAWIVLMGWVAISLVACKSNEPPATIVSTSFYFAETQPQGAPVLDKFPESFKGRYQSLRDTNLYLVITDTTVYSDFPTIFTITQAQLDTMPETSIQGNELVGLADEPLSFVQQADTFIVAYPNKSMVFNMEIGDVLKTQDDVCLLNYPEDNGLFSTLSLYFDEQNQLNMGSIDHEPIMHLIQQFGQLKQENIDGFDTWIAAPTATELKTFIDSSGFNDSEHYLR